MIPSDTGSPPEVKFSDLMEQGAARSQQAFYTLLVPDEDAPSACALGAACLMVMDDPYLTLSGAERALDRLEKEYDLCQSVTLRRSEFPEFFADLEKIGFVDKSEDWTMMHLTKVLIPLLNDNLRYSVPKISAIVRQLGY
jgi:hypothetical protein